MTSAAPTTIGIVVGKYAAAAARREVTAVLQAWLVGDDAQADVELMVSELVSNVVRHETATTMSIDVVVDIAGPVTVTVSGGVGDVAPELIHPAGAPPVTSEGGRGLLILDLLATAWGTRRENGTTSVWFTTVDSERLSPGGNTATVHRGSGDVSLAPVEAAVMGEAVAVVAATAAELTAQPEVVATRAAVTAQQAALDAATKTADAARDARVARANAAIAAAAAVAEDAARTVEAVQQQADELALAVAEAAAQAAATVSSSLVAGGGVEAARTASQVGAVVLATAVAKAEETARAAVLVARAVAAAAAAVASTTAAAAAAMEDEVLDAAVAVQAVTAATARDLAADTFERGSAVALANREALAASAASSERLHEANRQLEQASRYDRLVALALQEAMLSRLPESDRLQLEARYLTAAERDQVGGDWYDAVALPNGTTTLVIGDVVGHDIEAAAMMGQLRNILRALVWERSQSPSDVVGRLDRAIRDLRIETVATLILVNVEAPMFSEPGSVATLRWSNAGHPAPVLVDPNGTAITLDATTDLLLGVQPETVRREHLYAVPPGATLLLYTDGLVETRTDDIDVGQRRLLEAVRSHHHREPGDLLDAVLTDMVGDRPGDDVAVLAVRFQNSFRPADAVELTRRTPDQAVQSTGNRRSG